MATLKAAELPEGEFGLVTEVVAPGWERENMQRPSRDDRLAPFPQHRGLIVRFTVTR